MTTSLPEPSPVDGEERPRDAAGCDTDLSYRSTVLVLLAEQEGGNDDLLRGLAELGFDARSATKLHRVLRDLEDQGLVTSRRNAGRDGGAPRRVRTLTAAGTAHLRDMAPVMMRQRNALDVMLGRYRDLSPRWHRPSTNPGRCSPP